MVVATQNPIEYEGTFNLPEAQMDRFLMRVSLGYPGEQNEMVMLKAQQFDHPINDLDPAAGLDELMKTRTAVKSVHVSEPIEKYIVNIVAATRGNDDVYLGASPRGSLALYKLGQCRAAFSGRDYVIPDDIKAIAPYALAHRLLLQPSSRLQELKPEELIETLIERVKVPVS
jgi:MoxR-like ATPase